VAPGLVCTIECGSAVHFRAYFKPMPTGSHFSLERYTFGVYLELRKALEGLVEE
jgi:hypothetical protein